MVRICLLSIATALLLPAQSPTQKEFPKLSEGQMQRLRQRVLGLDYLSTGPQKTLVAEPAPAKTCSVPLLEIPVAKTDEKMVIAQPQHKSNMPLLQPPSPACTKEEMRARSGQ